MTTLYYETSDSLKHYGVKGMKWGVHRIIRGHSGPGHYLTKKRQLVGDKKDLEYLKKGGHLSIGLTKKRQAAYDKRDKTFLENRIAKTEQKISDKQTKKELKSDVKEFRKLRRDFAKSVNKSVRKKTTFQDESRNLNKLKTLNDFVDGKIQQKGKDYTARMLDMVTKKDTAHNRRTALAVIGTGVAASIGLAWLNENLLQ